MLDLIIELLTLVSVFVAFVFACDTSKDCFDEMEIFELGSQDYKTSRTLFGIFTTLSLIIGAVFVVSAINVVFG